MIMHREGTVVFSAHRRPVDDGLELGTVRAAVAGRHRQHRAALPVEAEAPVAVVTGGELRAPTPVIVALQPLVELAQGAMAPALKQGKVVVKLN